MAGDMFNFEPPRAGGSGVPTSRAITAGTGLSGGGDLSADRTLALAETAVTPGSYTSTNLTVDAEGRITAAANGSGGGGPPHAARLTMAFEGGGSIAAWQGYPLISTGSVSYAPYGGTRAEGVADFATLIASQAGTYTVSFVYDADDDIQVAVRVKPAGGAYSRLRYEPLSLNNNSASFTVVLAAGDSLSLHFAPAGGGSVALTYWEVWL